MRVIICGGGTAGHIYPGLALAEALSGKQRKIDLLYVGTASGLESELVPRAGYSFRTISARGFSRKFSLTHAKTLFLLVRGCFESYRILKEFRPNVVVGTGGYVSAPLVLVATFLKIPTLIHEQNAIPGAANKFLEGKVDLVTTSFSDTTDFFSKAKRKVVVGNPIRRRVLEASHEQGVKIFGLDKLKKTVLIFGGSRGSKNINQAVIDSYKLFSKYESLQILHFTGYDQFEEVKKAVDGRRSPDDKINYVCRPYTDEIGAAYATSSLVVCRAGATTIAEVTSAGLPAVLIPYPYATGKHQQKNAEILKRRGAAKVILDENLDGGTLFKVITKLIFDAGALGEMRKAAENLARPNAASDLAKLVTELAERSTKA